MDIENQTPVENATDEQIVTPEIPETPVVETEEPKSNREQINDDVKAAVEAQKQRARAPDGKFAKEAPEKIEAPKVETKITDQDTSKATEQAVSTPSLAPPVSWSADAKAAWQKLPPAVQQAALKREQEVSAGFAQKSEELKRYEQTLTPVRSLAQRYNVQEDEAINRLISANDYLEKDAPGAIKWLAQAYGVDLSKINETPSAPPPVQQVAPLVPKEVEELKSRVDAWENSQVKAAIQQFASDPKNKYFAEVRAVMGSLMQSGQATTIQEAYDMAIWLNQDVRMRVLADRDAEAEAKRKQEAQERAEKAKKAAVSVRGAPTRANLAPKTGSVGSARDDVKAAIEQLRGDA